MEAYRQIASLKICIMGGIYLSLHWTQRDHKEANVHLSCMGNKVIYVSLLKIES